MPRTPGPARVRRSPLLIALSGVAAFAATLAIPAVAVLWWLWSLAIVTVTVTAVRRGRLNPGATAARGR